VISAERDGYISQVQAETVGRAAVALGAGREKKSDSIDLAVGLEVHVKVGQPVSVGQPLIAIHANDRSRLDAALALLQNAISISADPAPGLPLIYDVIEGYRGQRA
jgi:thymidine phosphorylase